MADAEQTIEFLRSLRAARRFRPEPVPDDVVNDLLEVARWSGSSMNRQPWEFIVVRDQATLKALSELGGYVDHLAGASLAIVLVMRGESHVDETYDEGRVSERIMLAAKAHGVGSCIAWFQPGQAEATARHLLAVPEGRILRTAISLGYPDHSVQRPRPTPTQSRKSLAKQVHHERYTPPM